MKLRGFDALRLDVEAFAVDAATLEGRWPLTDLPRLTASASEDAPADTPVAWRANGRTVPARVGPAEIWLDLHAHARMPLQCQRCLGSVETEVAVDRSLRFVAGEEQAAVLDADSEDDVLALNRAFDLRELVEDELILALPLVPVHEVCPQPLRVPGDDLPVEADSRPNPFAVLAALKSGKPGGTG